MAVANQKGGVAKTTTVASTGAALAEAGRKVLLIDLDPQACLTFAMGVEPDQVQFTVHDVLLGRLGPRMAITETPEGAGSAAGLDRVVGRGDATGQSHRPRVRPARGAVGGGVGLRRRADRLLAESGRV